MGSRNSTLKAGLHPGTGLHTLRLKSGKGLFLGLLHACLGERQALLVLAERLLVPLLVYARLCASTPAQGCAPRS